MKAKLITALVIIACVIVAVLLYFFIPAMQEFVLRQSRGWRGMLWLGGFGVLLGLYFAIGLGYRGKALWYAIFVILFTAVCIWFIANWDTFNAFLESHLSGWGRAGVFLIIIILVGLGLMLI